MCKTYVSILTQPVVIPPLSNERLAFNIFSTACDF